MKPAVLVTRRLTDAVHERVQRDYEAVLNMEDRVLSREEGPRHRREAQATRSYAIPLSALLERGDLSRNFPIQPGDVISVPQRGF